MQPWAPSPGGSLALGVRVVDGGGGGSCHQANLGPSSPGPGDQGWREGARGPGHLGTVFNRRGSLLWVFE